MQVGFLRKYIPTMLVFEFNKEGDLHSLDINVPVKLEEDVISLLFDDSLSERKYLIFPENAYGEKEELFLRLDAQGWEGVELELDEWNYEFILHVIDDLREFKIEKEV